MGEMIYIVKTEDTPPRPRQKAGTHFWLFLFTAGIGNVFYALSIQQAKKRWDKRWG